MNSDTDLWCREKIRGAYWPANLFSLCERRKGHAGEHTHLKLRSIELDEADAQERIETPSDASSVDEDSELSSLRARVEALTSELDAANERANGEWSTANATRRRAEAAEADNEKLRHRLFPSQGEGYASEVERQRNVIDGLKHAAEVYRDKAEAAEAQLAATEAEYESSRQTIVELESRLAAVTTERDEWKAAMQSLTIEDAKQGDRLARVQALADRVENFDDLTDEQIIAKGWSVDFVEGQRQLTLGIRAALDDSSGSPTTGDASIKSRQSGVLSGDDSTTPDS